MKRNITTVPFGNMVVDVDEVAYMNVEQRADGHYLILSLKGNSTQQWIHFTNPDDLRTAYLDILNKMKKSRLFSFSWF